MSISEVRTQIYLPGKTHRALKERARRQRKSMASVVREALTEYLVEPQAEPYDVANDPILKLAGSIQGDPATDVAENHDYYLYGVPKSEWPTAGSRRGARRR